MLLSSAILRSVCPVNGVLPSNACSTTPSSKSPRVMSLYSASAFRTFNSRRSMRTPVCTRSDSKSKDREVERVQTGVRIERRLLKVLKALAEYKDMTLGDLLEGVVLHAFDGKTPFTGQTLRKIAELKSIYELDLDARSSHRLREKA